MKRKTISKKGKKNWRRNIDTRDIEQTVEQVNRSQKRYEEYKEVQEKVDKQQNDGLMFYVEDQQQLSRSKRQPLDPNRFKKKEKPVHESKADKKTLDKLVRQQLQKQTQNQTGIKQKQNENDTVEWDNESKEGSEEQRMVALVKPHPGQSYNPTFKQHQELLDGIVEKQQEDEKIRVFGSRKEGKVMDQTKKIKKRKMNQREGKQTNIYSYMINQLTYLIVEIEKQKKQKKDKNQPSQLKKITKELVQEHEQLRMKKQLDQVQKNNDKELNRQGLKDLKQKFGKYKYKLPTKAFQLQDELSDNLRTLNNQNEVNLRERFDGFYRRRMLERGDPFKSKNNKRRMKEVDLDRRKMDKEDKMGELGIM